MRRTGVLAATALLACAGPSRVNDAVQSPSFRSETARYLDTLQGHVNLRAPVATGSRGAVAVAYGPFAARAGLELLERGGNALDAALTTALTQVAVTAGSPVSYFGIMSLVYYDARTREVHTLWAGWNTVKGETSPLTIPGGISLDSGMVLGTVPSGRTALVGGFMKGVEAAHRRFGRLPWAALFDAPIVAAERGMRVHPVLAGQFSVRARDLARLPATRAILLKPDGTPYATGETLRQPALAATLRRLAAEGADYMYGGAWGQRLVAAVQADGGRMTLEDLREYRAIWNTPLRARFGSWEVVTLGAPNTGGVALIEAQRLADVAGIPSLGHWSRSGESLRRATAATQGMFLGFLPPEMVRGMLPGRAISDSARLTPEHAAALWPLLDAGRVPVPWAPPRHSDDVVVIDAEGNMAAITHSINCVYWGKTAINIDGISIGDPASYQQAAIARAGAGKPLPDPTETGVLLKDGVPLLAFASMGSGLHQRTFAALTSIMRFGMSVDEAIDAPDFFLPSFSPRDSGYVLVVPRGRFSPEVLKASGRRVREVDAGQERLGGEGVWVGISRDPTTGVLRAAGHNRSNAAALAR